MEERAESLIYAHFFGDLAKYCYLCNTLYFYIVKTNNYGLGS